MFTYEIKTDKKDGHEYIEITGYETSVAHLNVPGEIDGIKVEAIGNHSFSGRSDIVQVTLPDSIRTLYGFAFHNCRNLKKISLYDSIDDYYDGVCRQCDSLRDIEIVLKRGWYEVVRNFLADFDGNLRFKLTLPDGEKALLMFPGYVYDFNENTMARTIQFSIAGSGYAFRECVDRRRIDYRQYDSLFEKAVIDGGEIAQDISVYRILYPVELESRYRSVYEKYIRDNAEKILERYVKKCAYSCNNADDILLIRKLLEHRELFGEMAVNSAIELSVQLQDTVLTALLMSEGSAMAEKTVTEFAF